MNTVRPKKIPQRRCAGCGQSFPKKDLIRVVRTPEGGVETDATGKRNGRGVYVCRAPECFAKVKKQKKLDRSLETAVPDEIYAEIEKMISPEGVEAPL